MTTNVARGPARDIARRRRRGGWRIPAALIALGLVPSIAGAARLGQLATGAPVTAENARFFDMPVPVVAHIVAAVLYSLAGAFQFAPAFRRRHLRWHRWAGRVLAAAGLVVAVSGMWMAVGYDVPPVDGLVVEAARLIVGAAMLTALVLAVVTVRRRDIAAHRAWMIRAYALALGAGTQVLTHLPFALAGVTPGMTGRAIAMVAGWAINIAVAEWIIRGRPRPRALRPA
ncbi:putative membrane protein [Actinoplanes octamycinicus]|uniref:Putative membrane protein n=1 Tax=Actinoplanes octamycinicus TaxID=135948 RepID=A0A7W7MBY3_9ACTN|nr:DUF2306 domain-containing protein [Actinoplanes octamycinicus]MBB4744604.1 putative membrane protein [Actinoplanes octamycinicus]GIE63835.1 membrane protein [Actinoplanes octamycinicus]